MIIVSKPKISCEPKKISLRGDPLGCRRSQTDLGDHAGLDDQTYLGPLGTLFLDTVLEIKGEGG